MTEEFDIHESLKQVGFVYREPDLTDPIIAAKLEKAKKICMDEYVIDIRDFDEADSP